jgi:hypothetical protein
VIFDGSAWVATVRKLPVTFSSAPSLPETIVAVRDAIAHEFDAGDNLADRRDRGRARVVDVTDPKAAAAFARDAAHLVLDATGARAAAARR